MAIKKTPDFAGASSFRKVLIVDSGAQPWMDRVDAQDSKKKRRIENPRLINCLYF